MKNSVKKNYAYNVIYQIINIFVPIVTTPYVSRVLGVDAIGNFSYTASIVSYFSLFATLGFSIYGQREIAYRAKDTIAISILFYEIQSFKFISTASCVLLLLLFTHFFADTDYKTILYIQTLTVVAVFFDISWLFQGLENFKITVMRNLIVKIIGLVLIFTFVHRSEDLELYIVLQCCTQLVGNISLWKYLPKYICRVEKSLVKPFENTRKMLELFVPMIAIQVYTVLDKTMIGGLTNSSYENGCYEQVTKIVAVLMAIITSLGVVMLPTMASIYAEQNLEKLKKIAEKAYCYVIFISCPLGFGLISISDTFVPFFLGNGYDKSVPLLKIYALVLLIIPLSNIAGYAILTPIGQHNKGTLAVILGALINFCFNLVLIPKLLSVGAAISSVIAEAFVTIIHLIFIRKYIHVTTVVKYYISQVLISTFMCVCVYFSGIYLKGILNTEIIVLCIQVMIGIVVFLFIQLLIVKEPLLLDLLKHLFQMRKNNFKEL